MAAERVKCVNDKDPTLVPDMVRHEDTFYEVSKTKKKNNYIQITTFFLDTKSTPCPLTVSLLTVLRQ
jgi:hypothetical protein